MAKKPDKITIIVASVLIGALSLVGVLAATSKKKPVIDIESQTPVTTAPSLEGVYKPAVTEDLEDLMAEETTEPEAEDKPKVTVMLEHRLNICWVSEPKPTNIEKVTDDGLITEAYYSGLLYISAQGGSYLTISDITKLLKVSDCELLDIGTPLGDVYNPDGIFVPVSFKPKGLIDSCEIQVKDDSGQLYTYPMQNPEPIDLSILNAITLDVDGAYLCLYNPCVLQNQTVGVITYDYVVEYNTYSVTSPDSRGGGVAVHDALTTDEMIYLDGNGIVGISHDTGVLQIAYFPEDLDAPEDEVQFTYTFHGIETPVTINLKELRESLLIG